MGGVVRGRCPRLGSCSRWPSPTDVTRRLGWRRIVAVAARRCAAAVETPSSRTAAAATYPAAAQWPPPSNGSPGWPIAVRKSFAVRNGSHGWYAAQTSGISSNSCLSVIAVTFPARRGRGVVGIVGGAGPRGPQRRGPGCSRTASVRAPWCIPGPVRWSAVEVIGAVLGAVRDHGLGPLVIGGRASAAVMMARWASNVLPAATAGRRLPQPWRAEHRGADSVLDLLALIVSGPPARSQGANRPADGG